MQDQDPKVVLAELLEQTSDPRLLQKTLAYLNGLRAGEDEVLKLKEEVKSLREERDKIYTILSFWLGSPLNTLHMLSGMLTADIPTMDRDLIEETARHVDQQIRKLHDQMGNLIAWADHEVKNFAFHPETVALAALVSEISVGHQAHAQAKGIQWSNEVSDDLLVQADARMLRIILTNLLSNAVKFSKKGDTVQLIAEATDHGTVRVTVRDTGIGMGAAKAANVFNPARKATQKGTANENGFGLGMPVVRAYLLLHGAQPAITCEQGKGVTVTFELPEVR